MSIRIGGGPPPGPRAPTHQPVPMPVLMELGQKLREAAPTGSFTVDQARAVATEAGVPIGQVFAAAAVVGARSEQTCPTAFVVCAGGCQGFGAVECFDALVSIRDQRAAAGKSLFDIHAFGCLDACAQGPAVRIHAPAGVAMIPLANATNLAEAVAQVLD